MDAINRPRSITKAVAITAITLTVATFATAFGIGMRAVLWEIKAATAEMNKAAAAMEQAKSTVLAAKEQALATIQAAQQQASAIVEQARISANATVEAAQRGVIAAQMRNYGEIATTNKFTGPAVLEPINERTTLTKRIEILKEELKTQTDYQTHGPLAASQIQAKQTELAQLTGQRHVVQNYTGANIEELGTTFMTGAVGAFKNVFQQLVSKPSVSPKQ